MTPTKIIKHEVRRVSDRSRAQGKEWDRCCWWEFMQVIEAGPGRPQVLVSRQQLEKKVKSLSRKRNRAMNKLKPQGHWAQGSEMGSRGWMLGSHR